MIAGMRRHSVDNLFRSAIDLTFISPSCHSFDSLVPTQSGPASLSSKFGSDSRRPCTILIPTLLGSGSPPLSLSIRQDEVNHSASVTRTATALAFETRASRTRDLTFTATQPNSSSTRFLHGAAAGRISQRRGDVSQRLLSRNSSTHTDTDKD